MKKSQTISGRLFEVILYLDDLPLYYDRIMKLEEMCSDSSYSYWYIVHDKEKKNHCHFLIYTNGSTTTLEHIAKTIDIESNYIEKKNFLTSSIKYLTHESTNSKDKVLYDWHDISTNDLDRLNKIYENLYENTYIREFKSFIDDSNSIITYNEFTTYVLQNNLWSYYRRSAAIIKLLIDEHNQFIKDNW